MAKRRTLLWLLTAGIVAAATPAAADFRLERRLALAPGGTFTLHADAATVFVTGDSTSGVAVTITSRRDDLDQIFDFEFTEDNDAATVRITRRAGWVRGLFSDWFEGGGSPRVDVHVPRTSVTDVRTSGGSVHASGLAGNVRVRSSGGSLRVETVKGDVDAHTSGGSIRAQAIDGALMARTSGGSIDVDDVGGTVRAETSGGSIEISTARGEVFARTSGGSVRVQDAGDRVEAHSSGGPVTVGFAKGNARGGILSSSGGGVRTELDPSVALSIDASSSGGQVNSDLPVTTRGQLSRGSLRADLNGGGALLRLRSSGGGVRIAGTAAR